MSEHFEREEGFIPKYILEELAEKGDEDAKRTLAGMQELAMKEDQVKKKNIESQAGNNTLEVNASVYPKRGVYDSQGTGELQHKLARQEGDPPNSDQVVNLSYDFCGKTLEYFKLMLNRNSIDGNGMDVISNVHFRKDYNNAVWLPNQNQLALGDGDGKRFINLGRSIDVVAHEMAHGVTEYVNHLDYTRQSGALNEHFSDVIGTAVQQYVKGQTAQTADWLIGDEIVGSEFRGKALRSMKEPGTAYFGDRQVAHFSKYMDIPLSDDGGGVHYFSGIPNKAFFLAAMQLGTDPATLLWYTALHDRETIRRDAKFVDLLKALLIAAEKLIRQGELPQSAISVVTSAFSEVGILLPVHA